MGDDGTGSGIRIPSMLIGKSDGELLKQFATEKGATLSAEFTVKTTNDKVNVEYWYSSTNVRALDFLKEFDQCLCDINTTIPNKRVYGITLPTELSKQIDDFKYDQFIGLFYGPL